MNETKTFLRQLDLVRPSELDFPITIIGAGGIGSWAAFALAKMGCSDITVIDFDRVEAHNVPSQLYRPNQIGQPKVEALRENISQFTGVDIKPIGKKFQDAYSRHESNVKVIICSVDSLEERRKIWEILIHDTSFECYVDARMGGELMKLYVVSPFHQESVGKYMKSLDPRKKAYQEVCTSKAIIYNTFICGGMIASTVKRYAKKEEVKPTFTFDISNAVII